MSALADNSLLKRAISIFILVVVAVAALVIGAMYLSKSTALVGQSFPGFMVTARMAVTNEGQPDWTGAEAGLGYPDLILAANGAAVASLDDLMMVVAREAPGTSIEYTVLRKGNELAVFVPSMMFGWAEYFVIFGVKLVVAFCFSLIGFVVLVLKFDNKVSWVFFAGCISISFVLSTAYPDIALVRVNLAASVLELAAAAHFGLLFPYQNTVVGKYPPIQALPYVIAAILIAGLEYYYPGPEFLFLWKLRLLFELIALMIVLQAIFHQYFFPKNILAKQRARILLIGATLAFPFPVAAYASQTLFGTFLGARIDLIWISIPMLLFPIAIGYSIVKHNLFDADTYVKRTVGYIIMTAILASGYLGLQSGVRILLDPVIGEAADSVYPVLYAILVVFLFNPINTRIQSLIDRLFYRKEYDFKEVVQGVERSLASVLDINTRMQRLVNTLRETLFLDTAGIVVYAGDSAGGNSYFEISGDETAETAKTIKTRDMRINRENPLTALVLGEGRLITRFDVEEDKKYSGNKQKYLDEFDRLDSSICIPLIHNEESFGVVFLGDKKSGKFFNKQDIDLVSMLSARGAVAIDNAQLVEQMKKEEAVRGNLARYLSPEIVDRVVSDDMEVNLGGQRKVVSVLFSDIRGFTTISESWPPDQLVTILNEYMTEMVAVVFENKGSIDKFVGDAIVAVFGSLVEVENHAQHAVQAALGMQSRLVGLNRKWQLEYRVDLGIGVGINTGEVFLGNIGSPDRMEFTVIGDAVNLAARLEGLTKYYEVGLIVSEFTRKSLTDMLCRKLDLVQVKGKKEAVAIYEPLCASAEADETLRGELLQYDKALSAYYEQDWDNAGAIFDELQGQYPERRIYSLYRERIGDLRAAGLPADWDGVFVHTEK